MPIAKVRLHKAGSAQKHIEARHTYLDVRRSKVKEIRALSHPHTPA